MDKYVGRSTRSKEGPRHVSGSGLFTDDLRLAGMLHAVILRSPHAHARILSVNAEPVIRAPGVVATLTPDNLKKNTKPFRPGRYSAGLARPILEYAGAIDKVRYLGEPVAAVAARTRAEAEDALELFEAEYEPLTPIVETADALRPESPPIFEELGSNMAWTGTLTYGDIEGAFKQADKVVKERLKIHRYSSTPLEPLACISSFEAASKKLTVWINAQVPDVIYDALRDAFGLDDVRVIIPDIGGGFGQKIHLIKNYAVLTSFLAIKSHRPVKWIEDRNEHMMAAGHACQQEFEVEAAVKKRWDGIGA